MTTATVERKIKGLDTENRSAFFNTQEKDVYVEGRKVESKKAVVREDTQEVLSIMSKNYKPVNNKAVLMAFDEIATEAKIEWKLDSCYQIQNGTKTFMKIVFPGHSLVVGKLTGGKPDILWLEGYLGNGFDGFNAATLDLSWLRQICTNGMIGRLGKVLTITIN